MNNRQGEGRLLSIEAQHSVDQHRGLSGGVHSGFSSFRSFSSGGLRSQYEANTFELLHEGMITYAEKFLEVQHCIINPRSEAFMTKLKIEIKDAMEVDTDQDRPACTIGHCRLLEQNHNLLFEVLLGFFSYWCR